MSKKNILVLGSKPGSMLPNIKVEKIYTANGAAEKAQKYLDRFPNTPFTAVIGGREFEKNEDKVSLSLRSRCTKKARTRSTEHGSGFITIEKTLSNIKM